MRESQALGGQARLLADGQTTAGSCYKGEASMATYPKACLPQLVTPEEKGREMAKCLLGLKLSNYIKW